MVKLSSEKLLLYPFVKGTTFFCNANKMARHELRVFPCRRYCQLLIFKCNPLIPEIYAAWWNSRAIMFASVVLRSSVLWSFAIRMSPMLRKMMKKRILNSLKCSLSNKNFEFWIRGCMAYALRLKKSLTYFFRKFFAGISQWSIALSLCRSQNVFKRFTHAFRFFVF